MKRIERWIVTLLLMHFLLLIGTQVLINETDYELQFNPVFEYFGVYHEKDGEIQKTIDHILDNVLSF
jgi:hypothetical protein